MSTRPLFGGEWPGNEASFIRAEPHLLSCDGRKYMYCDYKRPEQVNAETSPIVTMDDLSSERTSGASGKHAVSLVD